MVADCLDWIGEWIVDQGLDPVGVAGERGGYRRTDVPQADDGDTFVGVHRRPAATGDRSEKGCVWCEECVASAG